MLSIPINRTENDEWAGDGSPELTTFRPRLSTALIKDLLSSGYAVRVRVTGRSMAPFIGSEAENFPA